MSTTPKTIVRKFTPVRNANDIHISPAPDGAKTGATDDPTLIILFGWMDASLSHIFKYTESYHKLYPGATQVIIQSSQAIWLKSQSAREAEVAPAAKVLRELGISNSESDRILVHTFSNGGCFELITLSNVLRQDLQDHSVAAIPAKAIVFDSCPGDSSSLAGAKGLTASIRNPILRTLASGIVLAILGMYHGVASITGMADPFVTLQKRLLSPQTLPQDVPKTFICSKTDSLVPYQVTLEFAEQCKLDGANVDINLYENTPHVNHVKGGPEKYWRIVAGTWDRAVGKA